jgi:hypothetical protein
MKLIQQIIGMGTILELNLQSNKLSIKSIF